MNNFGWWAGAMGGQVFALKRRLMMVCLGCCLLGPVHSDSKAFISDGQSGRVHVVDTLSAETIATIDVGGQPFGVAVDSAAGLVYVARSSTPAISVIDADQHTLLQTVPLLHNARAVALTPDGGRLYVTHDGVGKVTIIDTATLTSLAVVDIAGAFGVAAHPEGDRVYVSKGGFAGGVAVIDVQTNQVVATAPTAAFPRGVAVHPEGHRVYVAAQGGQLPSGLSVIDTASNTLISTTTLGTFPYGVAVDPSGERVYVSNNGSSQLSVVDARSDALLRNVDLGEGYPLAVGADASSGVVLVTQSQPPALKMLDARCMEPQASIPMDALPAGIGSFVYTPQSTPRGITEGAGMPMEVTGIELTQAIQDLAHSAPLISDRRTFARVHVRSTGSAVPRVTATLSAMGYFQSGGSSVEVPLGHIMPSNPGGPRITVRPEPRRSILDESFLFELPWRWTQFPGLRVHATLSVSDGPPIVSCAQEVRATPARQFEEPIALAVRFARLAYRLPDGTPVSTSIQEAEQSASFLLRTLPISTLHSPIGQPLEDPELAAFVARSHPSCAALLTKTEDFRSLCAYYRVADQLWRLMQTTSYGDGFDVVYGLIPQDPGMPFTRGACCQGKASAGPANDPDYATHEIGHFFGREHPSQASGTPGCGHSDSDPAYPYFFTHIAPLLDDPATTFAGFDVGDPALGRPLRVLPHPSTFDIMGYCGPTTWISDYTYREVRDALVARPLQWRGGVGHEGPAPGDHLLVSGWVDPQAQRGSLDVLRVDHANGEPPGDPGEYGLRFLDAGGELLASLALSASLLEDTATGESGGALLGFRHVLPHVVGAREIRLVHLSSGAVLDSIALSAHLPVIGEEPIAEFDAQAERVSLAWTASDADGDALQFDVFVLHEGDGKIEPLVRGLAEAILEWPAAQLPGGSLRLRVVASDGLQAVTRDSNLLLLPPRAPTVRIRGLVAGARYRAGQAVVLDGEAWDLQDGVLDAAAFAWKRAGVTIGSGERVDLIDLPVGTHEVELEVVNSLGVTGSASVSFEVDGSLDGPGPTLVVGPSELAWQLDGPTTVLQQASLAIGNPGDEELDFTIGDLPPWISAEVSSGSTPATLQIVADPAGVPSGGAITTMLVLHASSSPVQTVEVPIRLAVGDTFSTGNAAPPVQPDALHTDGFELP